MPTTDSRPIHLLLIFSSLTKNQQQAEIADKYFFLCALYPVPIENGENWLIGALYNVRGQQLQSQKSRLEI